jgi:hypothetical protein
MKILIHTATLCALLLVGSYAQAELQYDPPKYPPGWHNFTPVYVIRRWPPKVRMGVRADLTVRAANWDAAIAMLVQKARELKTNGIFNPHKFTSNGLTGGSFIEVKAQAVFFRDPQEIIDSKVNYVMAR